jgi:23S rRNA pseudouridine1911/1915/1917 synthase
MSASRTLTFNVTAQDAGQRLDVYLTAKQVCQSRNQVARLITENHVRVAGVKMARSSYKVIEGDEIHVYVPAPISSEHLPEDIPIEILFEDDDLVVINKPAGLSCHPGAGHQTGTLVNALLFRIKNLSSIGGVERPGLVHRLDKETSGVLVVAKNDMAHLHLASQFKNRTTHRIYWALVAGVPKESSGEIRSLLSRHPTDRKRFASNNTSGKLAITLFELKKSFGRKASLLHVKLQTGRTHQIRVHLTEKGHPVLGDALYGQKFLSKLPQEIGLSERVGRHALHAAELGFAHPRTKAPMLFKTDWPRDLMGLLGRLESL